MAKYSIVFTALAFGVLGPAIGAALVIVGTYINGITQGQWWPADFEFAISVLAWAYALAFIPAAGTGFLWGLLARKIATTRAMSSGLRVTVGFALGAFVCFLAGYFWDAASSTRLETPHLVNLLAPCGAVAGGILAVIVPRTQSLSASNKPLNTGAPKDGAPVS